MLTVDNGGGGGGGGIIFNGQISNYFPVSNSSICLIIIKYRLKFQSIYCSYINIYNEKLKLIKNEGLGGGQAVIM